MTDFEPEEEIKNARHAIADMARFVAFVDVGERNSFCPTERNSIVNIF
jgi:hypothetical protein